MMVVLVFLAVLLLALCYVIYVRPFLERRGWVRPLPVTADSMRARLRVAVRGSLTMVWAWLVGFFGTAMLLIEWVAGMTDDPEIKAQVVTLLPSGAVPYVILGIAVVTGLARLRTARKGDWRPCGNGSQASWLVPSSTG